METTSPTSNLPELVVDGQDTKKKKAVKTNAKAYVAPTTAEATTEAPPPPGITLGTAAKSDTGTTTFDANNVMMRTDGGGDANTFMRNLPDVQYQNSNQYNPGATSTKAVDTKPALLSISGGRTYENNFILNGVSITNITGPQIAGAGDLEDGGPAGGGTGVHGMSPQSIYVPAEFIGDATIIKSNASAEYGQFVGGVVEYNLTAPPTDRYHASVSASRDTSDFANYILATPDGTNPTDRRPPTYEKSTLAVSVGAPITRDFAFIAQASRKEAESVRQKNIQYGSADSPNSSDNIFFRFAASARTDIGKFTLDTSRTEYFQHWDAINGRNVYVDVNTNAQSTKLEHETTLAGVSIDAIGLGNLNLKSRAFYNTSVTENNSGDNKLVAIRLQRFTNRDQVTGLWAQETFHSDIAYDWCPGVDPATYKGTNRSIDCFYGGFGNRLQGQTDYGAQVMLSGDVLLGNFRVGTEIKSYDGRNARLDENTSAYSPTTGTFTCADAADVPEYLCSENQYFTSYSIVPKHDTSATVNAAHTFAEIDQTWNWFNVRAGVRHDYDDYLKNNNFAPRLVGTLTPIAGLNFTAGYNRYYLGETLYYAIRDKLPSVRYYERDGIAGTTPGAFPNTPTDTYGGGAYKVAGLATPYSDEYTGSVGIGDRLSYGQLRLGYLERYGRDQFATESCGSSGGVDCVEATNDGESFYRSASAEYTKEWYGLRNPFNLNAAAITGNVTWSKQHTSQDNYLLSSDRNSDGYSESGIWYKGAAYLPEQFNVVTGNMDIPVRFGATLATRWFNDVLELNVNAGVNLGFMGAHDTDDIVYDGDIVDGQEVPITCYNGCSVYEDRKFGASLKLDVNGQINVTEQAAIQFSINNITNSTQQTVTTESAPWLLGRSYWLGSALRF
ncbi:MAG: hypothetical protein WC829_14565 [Hyphomicrobium sp.]